MRLSTKVRYGMRLMLELALHWNKGPVKLERVAQRQAIPLKYMRQIAYALEAGGLLVSVRGPGGGYILPRPPEDISLIEIVKSVAGSLSLVPCLDNPRLCERSARCATRELWEEASSALKEIFEKKKLSDLVKRQLALGGV